MSNIFVTSDTHFNHKNIVRGISNWPEGHNTRDFNTLEQHDSVIVNNINNVVGQDDILYHLGDWSFNGEENIKQFRNRIICKNIHLILGNHDHHIRKHPENYLGYFTSIQEVKYLTINKQLFFLSHFPYKIWDKMQDGCIHLYGHCHGSLNDPGDRSMDVGIDTNNFFPYIIDDILKHLLSRKPKILDHHK